MSVTPMPARLGAFALARHEAQVHINVNEGKLYQIFQDVMGKIQNDMDELCDSLATRGHLQIEILFSINTKFPGKLSDTYRAYTFDDETITQMDLSSLTEKFKGVLYPESAEVRWTERQVSGKLGWTSRIEAKGITLTISKRHQDRTDFKITEMCVSHNIPTVRRAQHEDFQKINDFCQEFFEAEQKFSTDWGNAKCAEEVENKIKEKSPHKDPSMDRVILLMQQMQNVELRIILNDKDKKEKPGTGPVKLLNAHLVPCFIEKEYKIIDLVHIINRLIDMAKEDPLSLWSAAFSKNTEYYNDSGHSDSEDTILTEQQYYKSDTPRMVFSIFFKGKAEPAQATPPQPSPAPPAKRRVGKI